MSLLFSQEEVMEMYGHECRLQGRKEGFKIGFEEVMKN